MFVKYIKKFILICFTLCVLVLLGCIVSFAYSSAASYEINELAMTVDVPTEISVVTREVKQSDVLFQKGVFDYIDTMADFRDNNIYLIGKDAESSFRINITMDADPTSKDYKNIKYLNTNEKNSIMESILNQDAVQACSVYETKCAVFFESLLKYIDNNNVYYIKQFYTVVNGQNINISIVSIGDDLNKFENRLIEDIVNSARFDITDGKTGGGTLAIKAVVAVVLIVCLAFAVFYIVTRRLEIFRKLDKLYLSKRNKNAVNGSTAVFDEKEDELNNEIMLDFLAKDNESKKDNNAEEDLPQESVTEISDSDLSKPKEDFTSIDIDVEKIPAENLTDEEDEELNPEIFTEDAQIFTEDEEDIDVPVHSSVLSDDSGNTVSDKESANNEDEEPVDIEAAIAYFQDDFETRKNRRDLQKEKNSQLKKKRFLHF